MRVERAAAARPQMELPATTAALKTIMTGGGGTAAGGRWRQLWRRDNGWRRPAAGGRGLGGGRGCASWCWRRCRCPKLQSNR